MAYKQHIIDLSKNDIKALCFSSNYSKAWIPIGSLVSLTDRKNYIYLRIGFGQRDRLYTRILPTAEQVATLDIFRSMFDPTLCSKDTTLLEYYTDCDSDEKQHQLEIGLDPVLGSKLKGQLESICIGYTYESQEELCTDYKSEITIQLSKANWYNDPGCASMLRQILDGDVDYVFITNEQYRKALANG